MTKTQDRIIDLSIEIKELRVRLSDKLQELDELTGNAAPKAPSGPAKARLSKPRAERKPRADGLPARILAFLGTNISSYTADELIGELKIEPEKVGQLRTTLSRLLKTGKIASPASGVYEAKK